MKKFILVVFISLFSLVVLSGCGNSTNDSTVSDDNNSHQKAKNGDELRIAFIPGSTTSPFYISMKDGAEEVAEELGVELIWQGAAEWDYVQQSAIVDNMITDKVDAIIIAPTDINAMVAPLQRAKDAGITVLTVDTNIEDKEVYVSNITSDNKEGGELAADTLAEMIDNEGKVMVMNLKPGVTTTDLRQEGFIDRIEKEYPKIEVVATEYMDNQATVAAKKVQDVLLNHPDLKGVFATGDVQGIGTAQGLGASNKVGEVQLLSYDASPEQIESLEKGEMQALISQKPLEEARLAMEMAVDYIQNNGEFDKQILLENIVVTPENMNDEEVKELLYSED